MDLQTLQAFMLVAENNSFSQAAEKLHLTQPAVSKRIALLEEQLGAPLFDRIGRQVSLTEAGKALLPHAKAVQQELAAAERAVRDLSGEVGGELRLATSHHIGLHRLPPVLSAFQRRYPKVTLDIEFLDSELAYDRLRTGVIELAVVTLAPGDVTHLRAEELWVDRLRIMVATDHELVRANSVTLEELARHPAVLPGLETFTGQIVRRHFNAAGLPLELRLATNYLETLCMMASVGLGWTVLPDFMAGDRLHCLDVPGTTLSRTLGLVTHRERSASRGARAFMDLLRTTAADTRR